MGALTDADIRPSSPDRDEYLTTHLSLWGLGKEAWLLTKLALQLLTYLGIGWKWSLAVFQMTIYVTLLLPGFLQMVFFYLLSPRVTKNIVYGNGPRQQLDLYMPPDVDTGHSVVIFLTGGAWTIGYKAWGALFARRLSDRGVIVACLDYRNFPQGIALQMLEDVNEGVAWVCNNIGDHHGDPDNVFIVGHSAGAHLGSLALFRQAERMATGRATVGASPAWNPARIRGFVGISGAYDLTALSEHLHRRGLYRNLFKQIMSIDGQVAYRELSPLDVAKSWAPGISNHVPRMTLIHGTADKSAPHECSLELHQQLKAAGVPCSMSLIKGKGHTSFLLEDPMRGGRDLLTDMLVEVMVTGRRCRKMAGDTVVSDDEVLDASSSSSCLRCSSSQACFCASCSCEQSPHVYPMLCPPVLCTLAGYVCPF